MWNEDYDLELQRLIDEAKDIDKYILPHEKPKQKTRNKYKELGNTPTDHVIGKEMYTNEYGGNWEYNEGYNVYVNDAGLIGNGDRFQLRKQSKNSYNYNVVGVYDDNLEKHRLICTSRIVWETFVDEIPRGMRLTHINGDVSDDSLNNLKLIRKGK